MYTTLKVDVAVTESSDRKALYEELQELQERTAKIYTIECGEHGTPFLIFTTSKELCIGIAVLSTQGRGSFCTVLENAFNGGSELVLLTGLGKQGGGIFATRARNEAGVTCFHISPAN